MARRRGDPFHRGYPMGPQWGQAQPKDPNWHDGEYHGMRMRPEPGHGAYGEHRRSHPFDMAGYGGFDGIYDEGRGEYDRLGQYRHPYFEGRVRHGRSAAQARAYDAEYVENGGVRADARYLRQYNADSPMLRRGGRGGYDRGFGWAPAGRGEGELTNPDIRRDRTDERGYAGYNRGGFSPSQGPPGLDPRKG